MKNGTLGTVLAVEAGGERLTVRLDGPGGAGGPAGPVGQDSRPVVTFFPRDYGHVDHGYAATVHKAQGVTVDRAHVLASAHMDRHAAYVALTRHREGVALHWSAAELGDRAGLARTLGRERAKDTTLDYGAAYAARRGFDPLRPESAIVVRQAAPDVAAAAAGPVSASAVPAVAVAQGRARFRERFEAHRQLRADNEAGARALVGRWDELVAGFSAALPKLDADPAYVATREAMLGFGREAREQPGAVGVLRQRGAAFGMGERPNLARVLADARPERVVGRIVEAAEARMRTRLEERAAQQAAQRVAEEAARRQALEAPPRQRQGPSMGM